MPWIVKKVGDKFKVLNQDTGRVVGTHTSKKSAEAQQRALYANVPESRRRS